MGIKECWHYAGIRDATISSVVLKDAYILNPSVLNFSSKNFEELLDIDFK